MAQFQPATKRQARLRLALIGPAGSGKTYTALKVARRLGGRVALIDTERGSASKYADAFKFDTLQLTTFSPETYVEAIHAAEQAGYDVLIIDSLSHAWVGKGGALEMADQAARGSGENRFTAWRHVTPKHTALVDAMTGTTMHVIATMRSKMEYAIDKDERGKSVPRKVGMGPIQREGMEYEFDVVGDLDQENTLIITKTRCLTLAGATISKPGDELADTLKAWLTDGAPTYDREGRLAHLRELRQQIKDLGGVPPALTQPRVNSYTEQEIEAEIDLTNSEVERLTSAKKALEQQAKLEAQKQAA